MEVVTASVEQVRPLQQRVLRPGGPVPSDRPMPADWCHLALRDAGVIVGAASAGPEPPPPGLGIPTPSWHLRSVAVTEGFRNAGLGTMLVRAVVQRAGAAGVAAVWAEARVRALTLYVSEQWAIVGEEWDKPGIGPHRWVWKRP